MFDVFRVFVKYSHLLRELISRDLKIKYRRSTLGLLWSILNPLLMMLVITAVFQKIFRFQVENFALYYLTGSLLFNFVTEATNGAMGSMVSNAALIKKVYVPKYIFPMEKTMFAFVNMLFSSIAVIIIMLVQRFVLPWTAVLFFVPMLYTLVFSFGLGLILSAMNVFFRDVGHLYGVWTTAWIYLTPIIYPIDILPEWMLKVIAWNPLYYYVDYFRQVVMYGTIPGPRINLICTAFALGFLFVGLIIFKKAQDRFILYI